MEAWWRRYFLDLLLLMVLVVVTLVVRLPIARERQIMPAGDAFNLHSIASHLRYFDYPVHEKRLPGYSLTLLVGHILKLPMIPTSIAVSMTAGVGVVVGLYVLGRVLAIQRAALLALLGLSVFDPLLTMNAIRPLADSFFLFWVVMSVLGITWLLRAGSQSKVSVLWLTGLAITFMMFTRYEGFLIAGLLIPLLFFRLRVTRVLLVAVLPTLATLLWIPAYLYIHDSFTGLSYITDATAAGGGFGEVGLIPENVRRMLSTSWQRVWAVPAVELTQTPEEEAAWRVFSSGSWWISLLGLLGIPWLIIRNRLAVLPVLFAATGYTILLAWWWVYSRYVAPLEAVFYLMAAAGLGIFLTVIERVWRRRWLAGTVLAILLVIGIQAVFRIEALALHKVTMSQAWESNRKGYALYKALDWASRQDGLVGYVTGEHLVATLFLGTYEQPKTAENPSQGVYLPSKDMVSPDEIARQWEALGVAYIVETLDSPRMLEVITYLDSAGKLEVARVFEYVRWDDWDVEKVVVYRTRWKHS